MPLLKGKLRFSYNKLFSLDIFVFSLDLFGFGQERVGFMLDAYDLKQSVHKL